MSTWYERNRDRVLAKQRELAADPEWRAQRNARARDAARKRRTDPDVRTREYSRNVAYRYGAAPEQIAEMSKAQRGRCAICKRRKKLAVDHCHDSGAIRGLLCTGCNSGLGHLGDTPEGLMRAVRYLRDAQKRQQLLLELAEQ